MNWCNTVIQPHLLHVQINSIQPELHHAQAKAVDEGKKTDEVKDNKLPKDFSPKAHGASSDDEVVTRDKQLRFKSSKKGERKDKQAKNKTKKTKKNKAKSKTPTKPKVGRKRKVLKAQKAEEEPMQSKRPRLSSASCKEPHEEDVATSPPKSKGKAKKEASPKANASPKAKSKAQAKAKSKAQAKAKSKPQGKAENKAEPKAKAKAKGRPKKEKDTEYLERQRESMLFNAKQVEVFEKFAKSFDETLDVKNSKFKEDARAKAGDYDGYRLNIYWTRCSVGVTDRATGKDVVYYSYNNSSACVVHKIAVALKCGMKSVS